MLYKYFVTATAMLSFRQAGFSASRLYHRIGYFFMSKRIYDFLLYKYFVTATAVFAFGQARFRASRFYRRIRYFFMSEGGVFCRNRIGLGTTTAFCGLSSVFNAGCVVVIRIISKIMSKGIYDFLFYKHFVATRTMLAFGQARFSASCFDCFINYFKMTEGDNLVNFVILALGTFTRLHAFRFAGGGGDNLPFAPLVFAFARSKKQS